MPAKKKQMKTPPPLVKHKPNDYLDGRVDAFMRRKPQKKTSDYMRGYQAAKEIT